jgi:hypothetical protein
MIAVLVPCPVSAQVNTETLRASEQEAGFSGGLGFDLAARTGNVEIVQVGVSGRLDYVGDRATTFLVGRSNVGWKGGDRFINEGLLAARLVLRRGAALRPETFTQVNHNESRLLTFRWIVGVGLRTRLYQSRTAGLWWGSAFLFEHERLDLESDAVHPERTSVPRWSNYLSSRIAFTEQATMIGTVYVQPQFDRPRDMRVLGEASLGGALSESLSLVLTLLVHYDSRPPDAKKALDMTVKTGIGVEF